MCGQSQKRESGFPTGVRRYEQRGERVMDVIWDGVCRAERLRDSAVSERRAVADAAYDYDWVRLLELLAVNWRLANSTRPDGPSLFAPLHQAAHGGAPEEVVERLIDMGAWRTLRTAEHERPVDIARRRGYTHLLARLEPEYQHDVPARVLAAIQRHFHEVILGRAERLVREAGLRLPELEPLLELREPKMWFTVPGMYGGFGYTLEAAGATSLLVSESWCRVVGGSGQRHLISAAGITLVDEGFV